MHSNIRTLSSNITVFAAERYHTRRTLTELGRGGGGTVLFVYVCGGCMWCLRSMGFDGCLVGTAGG